MSTFKPSKNLIKKAKTLSVPELEAYANSKQQYAERCMAEAAWLRGQVLMTIPKPK